jgi:Zn-dependent protease with chaperone function
MFNNIIYFIVVLFIFATSYPAENTERSFLISFLLLVLTWFGFALYSRYGFQRIKRNKAVADENDGRLTEQYQRLASRLSILAIFCFAFDVYILDLKYWLQLVPGFTHMSVLQGISALTLFFSYLCTIWYFGYPIHKSVSHGSTTRRSFIISNLKLNLPILFPWVFLSLIFDIMALTPWGEMDSFLYRTEGQIIFFSFFLILLVIFLPAFIGYFWGCRPIGSSEKAQALHDFLDERGFKYREILNWPIFQGRMMTAGIMGILPRFRYILITESLLNILSIDELKAVVAHEMGHNKYRHLLLYAVFFLGFMVLYVGLYDLSGVFYTRPFLTDLILGTNPQNISIYFILSSLPMLLVLLVYFRYIVGFFMRNFERQADLYSAKSMGTPRYTISSLEKIALLSGKSRDLPSWHHFSIKQRVDYLLRTFREPGLIRRHNFFIGRAFAIYLLLMLGSGYFLNFSATKENIIYMRLERILNEEIQLHRDNIPLYEFLARVYAEWGKYREAIKTYEKIIDLNPNHAAALNDFAWLLVTVPREDLMDRRRGLELATRAVTLERSAVFLDTLAEAYYANGLIDEALGTIEEAISIAKSNKGYLKKQRKKFLASRS